MVDEWWDFFVLTGGALHVVEKGPDRFYARPDTLISPKRKGFYVVFHLYIYMLMIKQINTILSNVK
ncbi:hypothetical protein [Bacillus sp. 103mf]|uniref:hypothetical protein n=1 Tax=Bacillus sp. 103mf TaxID=1761751 RepID=UPI000B81B2AC|nr:hypothetical protein [Bacillus sp. 103mf]